MAFRDGIDLQRLDDWITGHGGQDQFKWDHPVSEADPGDEPNDQDATPLEKPDDEVKPDHELGGEA